MKKLIYLLLLLVLTSCKNNKQIETKTINYNDYPNNLIDVFNSPILLAKELKNKNIQIQQLDTLDASLMTTDFAMYCHLGMYSTKYTFAKEFNYKNQEIFFEKALSIHKKEFMNFFDSNEISNLKTYSNSIDNLFPLILKYYNKEMDSHSPLAEYETESATLIMTAARFIETLDIIIKLDKKYIKSEEKNLDKLIEINSTFEFDQNNINLQKKLLELKYSFKNLYLQQDDVNKLETIIFEIKNWMIGYKRTTVANSR